MKKHSKKSCPPGKHLKKKGPGKGRKCVVSRKHKRKHK